MEKSSPVPPKLGLSTIQEVLACSDEDYNELMEHPRSVPKVNNLKVACLSRQPHVNIFKEDFMKSAIVDENYQSVTVSPPLL